MDWQRGVIVHGCHLQPYVVHGCPSVTGLYRRHHQDCPCGTGVTTRTVHAVQASPPGLYSCIGVTTRTVQLYRRHHQDCTAV